MRMLRKLADGRSERSFAMRLRRRRFRIFDALLRSVPRPLTILDVGGEQVYWERMGLANAPGLSFVILNVAEAKVSLPNFSSVRCDARDMEQLGDGQFDVVFSNSVIEHVGSREDQQRMADEIRRVGHAYFVQTPNRYFPVEPHFLVPFFQFLPLRAKIFLIRHLDITYTQRRWTEADAVEIAKEVDLLAERDLRRMFPGATLRREKVLGLTKSLMVYGGWQALAARRSASAAAAHLRSECRTGVREGASNRGRAP